MCCNCLGPLVLGQVHIYCRISSLTITLVQLITGRNTLRSIYHRSNDSTFRFCLTLLSCCLCLHSSCSSLDVPPPSGAGCPDPVGSPLSNPAFDKIRSRFPGASPTFPSRKQSHHPVSPLKSLWMTVRTSPWLNVNSSGLSEELLYKARAEIICQRNISTSSALLFIIAK